jgi:hypothetical protein
MNERLLGAIAIVIFSLAVTALFGIVAVLAKLIFKKSIGTAKYYSTGAIAGALIFVAIISVLPKFSITIPTSSFHSEPVVNTGAGLDAPFIAPPTDKLETFPAQLNTAIARLPPADKALVNEAIAFLMFCTAQNVKETDPAKFAKWTDTDAVADSFQKIYRFAQENGDKMTLRKYLWLSDEFKKQKPEWVQQYAALSKAS